MRPGPGRDRPEAPAWAWAHPRWLAFPDGMDVVRAEHHEHTKPRSQHARCVPVANDPAAELFALDAGDAHRNYRARPARGQQRQPHAVAGSEALDLFAQLDVVDPREAA